MLTALAPADGEAVLSLADARAHLSMTAADAYHDAVVLNLRDDAISLIEEHSRRSLQARQFLWDIDSFARNLRPPVTPHVSVDSISYRNQAGVETALTAADWYLDSGYLNPAYGASWPAIGTGRGAVKIILTAGYLTAAEIPPLLLAGVKLALTAMFEERSNPDLSAALRLANKFRRRTL